MSTKSSLKKGSKILLFVILAALILTAVFFFKKAKDETAADIRLTMSTNAERVAFLNEQGWIVKPDPVSKEEIIIPSEISGAYKEYAKLLAEQGFNIKNYLGKGAILITYQVLNYPDYPDNVVANMLIADDRLIGGDISLNEENGFMLPLISPQTQSQLHAETQTETSVTTVSN